MHAVVLTTAQALMQPVVKRTMFFQHWSVTFLVLNQRLEQTLAETGTTVTSALLGVPLGGDDGEYSAEVDLSFWYDNSTDGEPDATGVTGNDGILTVELPSCQPLTTLAVRTIDTELTYKANFVIDPESPDAEVTVVESLTAASIKAILNESTSETSSLVAGQSTTAIRTLFSTRALGLKMRQAQSYRMPAIIISTMQAYQRAVAIGPTQTPMGAGSYSTSRSDR